MKKISFRVRNFGTEQFLTYNIDNEADLDEEVLDYIEDEEPEGIVPVIFDDEEEDCDTFSYDITDKIHLHDLSNQDISAEMVLKVLRGILSSLANMAEYRIPLSYLVINGDYIYIDSDYRVEFICIPLEDMNETPDVRSFLRSVIASLRFDPNENGDYVAKLLTYINKTTDFNMRNMITVIDELMENCGIEVPVDSDTEIYADFQEVDESISSDTSVLSSDMEESYAEPVAEEAYVEEPSIEAPVVEEPVIEEPIIEETPTYEDLAVETPSYEEAEPSIESVPEPIEEDSFEEPEPEMTIPSDADAAALEDAKDIINMLKKQVLEENSAKEDTDAPKETIGVAISDDLDNFLAEKDKEDKVARREEAGSGIKMKKNVKVSRASIVKNTQEELRAAEAEAAEAEAAEAAELAGADANEEEVTSGSILSQTIGTTGILRGTGTVPKVNPYLVRVNTSERIMITKQTFKLGKASMGVDYTVKGNGAVSRVHAIITNKDDVYYIKDNKSTNHTYVNGKAVTENELLTHDSKIVLGDEEFVFKLR